MVRIYYKGIQLDQIRGFCRVARLGSFAAAAAELELAAPTVWRQVRGLERECKTVLLERKGRSVQLTAEGKKALEMWEPHLAGIDSVPSLLLDAKTKAPRQLTVASTSMLLADYLVEPLRQYLAAEPAVVLSLLNEPADLVLRHVSAGEAHVGVVTYLPAEPRDAQLVYEDVLELPWLLATPRGHPLSRQKQLQLADLVEYPWIMPAQETQPRRHLEAVLRREGLRDRVRVVLESRTFALTRTYVAMGLGITLWYGFDPRRPAAGLWLKPATAWFGVTPVAIVARRGRHQPPHVESFVKFVRRGLAERR